VRGRGRFSPTPEQRPLNLAAPCFRKQAWPQPPNPHPRTPRGCTAPGWPPPRASGCRRGGTGRPPTARRAKSGGRRGRGGWRRGPCPGVETGCVGGGQRRGLVCCGSRGVRRPGPMGSRWVPLPPPRRLTASSTSCEKRWLSARLNRVSTWGAGRSGAGWVKGGRLGVRRSQEAAGGRAQGAGNPSLPSALPQPPSTPTPQPPHHGVVGLVKLVPHRAPVVHRVPLVAGQQPEAVVRDLGVLVAVDLRRARPNGCGQMGGQTGAVRRAVKRAARRAVRRGRPNGRGQTGAARRAGGRGRANGRANGGSGAVTRRPRPPWRRLATAGAGRDPAPHPPLLTPTEPQTPPARTP
jgi:hypothetical protein